jgi:U3 small nucleolar RNA-associated protein 15
LTALRHRSALRVALQGRDDVSLQPILKWTNKHIVDPRFVKICVDISLLLLDLYSAQMGQSPEIDALTKDLHRKVRKEVERAQHACQTAGMLGLLMSG